jgi:hypothetical protein
MPGWLIAILIVLALCVAGLAALAWASRFNRVRDRLLGFLEWLQPTQEPKDHID